MYYYHFIQSHYGNENYSISGEMEVDLTYNVVDNEEGTIVYLSNNY